MVTAAKILHVALHCDLDDTYRGAIAAIGNMDGVHLGHQALLEESVRLAGTAPKAAIVFDPHPRRVFAADTPSFQLTDLTTKAEVMGQKGIELLFVLPFIEDLYKQTPDQFVGSTLKQRLGLAGIVTGQDFKFGAGRAGDADALQQLAQAAGLSAHTIAPVMDTTGEKFSSSDVRNALREGQPKQAAAMLGRPWCIRGQVIEGRKLARTLDFPTANIELGDYLRPKYGVYVIQAQTKAGTFGGVANIGVRPTVDGSTELLEAHLFDTDLDLYGENISVDILDFIRPEQKFDGIDALKAQIAKDSDAARRWFTSAK